MKRQLRRNLAALAPLIGFSLVCLWTGILFFQNNSGRLVWSNISVQVAIVICLCGALWLTGVVAAIAPTWASARWSAARALTIWTIGIFLIFSYEAIRYWLREEFHLVNAPARTTYLLIAVPVLLTTWHVSRFEPVRVALSITAILLALFSLSSLLPIAANRLGALIAAPAASSVEGYSVGVYGTENVYFIILDSYGSPAALKKYLEIDVSPFVAEMGSLGYIHIKTARSNYTTTHASLAATLSMEYILDEKSPRYLDRGDFYPSILNQGRLPAVVRMSRSAGYKFIHVGNSWAPCHASRAISCLSGVNEVTSFDDVLSLFLAPTRLTPVIRRVMNFSDPVYFDALTPFSRSLQDMLTTGQRSFFFIHHLSPHEPLRNDCSLSVEQMTKDDYKNAVRCANDSALRTAKHIQEVDPRAIVVFQADHGSGFLANWNGPLASWSKTDVDERSSILNLVRLPEQCRKWIRPNLSPINTMRLVFGCIERRQPDYLDERSYLVAYETSPDFGLVRDVTEMMH